MKMRMSLMQLNFKVVFTEHTGNQRHHQPIFSGAATYFSILWSPGFRFKFKT